MVAPLPCEELPGAVAPSFSLELVVVDAVEETELLCDGPAVDAALVDAALVDAAPLCSGPDVGLSAVVLAPRLLPLALVDTVAGSEVVAASVVGAKVAQLPVGQGRHSSASVSYRHRAKREQPRAPLNRPQATTSPGDVGGEGEWKRRNDNKG